MKLILTLISLTWIIACGQQNPAGKDNVADKDPERFDSKYIRLIEDTSKMMMIENVVISYGDLYVEADSALLEKPKQLVTAFGIKKARFKSDEIAKDKYRNMIRYKKGDATFYAE